MITSQEHRKELIRRCIELELEPQVTCDGRIDSEIAIIGEAPGTQEVMQSMPFVGPAAAVLWNSMRQQKILRPATYMTNVCKRQISMAKINKHEVSADEWTKWQYLLHWELAQLPNLKYIIAFGDTALQALHNWHGIAKYRGSVYEWENPENAESKPVQVLYTYSPAAVLRMPNTEVIFQFDIRRFAQLTLGDYKPWPVDTDYDLTFEQAMEQIQYYKDANIDTAVDIELTSGALACIGFANDLHHATCFNFRDRLQNLYTRDQEIQLMYALEDCMQSLHASGHMIGQNSSFDSHYMGFKNYIHAPFNYDTLLAHHTLYPSLPHNLGFLSSMYTTIPYYKDELDIWKEEGDIATLWNYNGKDCCATLAAKQGTEKELKDQGLYDFFINHVMHLQPHLVQSTIHGIPVDLSVRSKIAAQLEQDLVSKLEVFHHRVSVATGLVSYKPNPGSWQQLKVLLYDHLNLKHRSGSTDDNARSAMLEDARTSNDAKEVLVAINDYKSDQKFYSTYVESKLDPDNRFRCDWKQYGVQSAPGRLSSSKTLWNTGMNAQNQPPKARQLYVADDDCVLIYFDLSQAEARVVGWHYEIETWMADFERARQDGNFDCHRSLAAEMFKVPYDDVPKSDRTYDDAEYTIRYIAKRCRHGLNYRMQIHRLAETTGLPFNRAAQAYHAYHKLNPELQVGWRKIENIVRRDRILTNAYGRRWMLMQRLDDEALKSVVAFYPQSTIGDKVTKVWYQAEEDDRWDSQKARITLNIHDALIGIAHKDYALTALSIMKAYAEQPIMIKNIEGTKVTPLIVPADTGMSVLEYKDKKTGLMMQDTKHRWSNIQKIKIQAATI